MIRPETEHTEDSGLADLLGLAILPASPQEGRGARVSDALASRLLTQDLPESSPSGAALQAAVADGYNPVLALGAGGSAEAWRCIDRSFGREVVVKVIRPERVRHPEEAEALLQREAEVLGKLSHPGIVHALRRAGAGKAAYLVLDFVDGDDLLSHCRLCELGAQDRLRLFGRAIDAAAYLHSKGVVHGDIKPEHLLVREDGYPVLIDFGLAAASGDAGRIAQVKGHIGGSGRYRAPEIVDGAANRSMPRQDVFALGEILRELMASCMEIDESLRADLETIIDKATSTDPDERWQDAGAFQLALRGVLTPQRPTSNAGSDMTSKPKASRINGLLVVAALALLACGGGGAWMAVGRDAPGSTEIEDKPPRAPLALTAQAGLLEGIAAHTYKGQLRQAEAALESALADHPDTSATWEGRHLQAGIEDQPFTQPYGDTPYGQPFALITGHSTERQSIAYVVAGDEGFEVWVRPADKTPIHIATTKHVVLAIALSPNAQQVATIEGEGQVVLRSIRPTAGEHPPTSAVLPRESDARGLWYSQGGDALYVFSPATRTVERWATTDDEAPELGQTFQECDHAYPLPSGEGGFILATRGIHNEDGRTLLRQLDADGNELRIIKLKDDQLPTSGDATPAAGGIAGFGMPNGYVRIYDPAHGGWQPPCDLGVNDAVPAVLYVEPEGRVFAACSRVFVIDTDAQLIMRLGDRDEAQQLLTRLRYDTATGALTSFGHQRIQQWHAPPTNE